MNHRLVAISFVSVLLLVAYGPLFAPVSGQELAPTPTVQPPATAAPVPSAAPVAPAAGAGTPSPIAASTPVSETTVVLTDDFAKACGLSQVDDENRSYRCDKGEYLMSFKVGNWMGWVWYGGQYDDLVAEADARSVTGGDIGYGLIFRRSSAGNYYAYQVASGRYFSGLYNDKKWTILIPWTDASAIQTGPAKNRLKVIVQGEQIALYVNDQFLETCQDATLTKGNVGPVLSNDQPGDQVAFSNVRISRINRPLMLPAAKPTALPTPTIPPGMGAVVVTNFFGQEINFTIAGKMYTVAPGASSFIFLPPGVYPTSGTMAGTKLACTSSCSIDVKAGKYSLFTFG